MISLRIIFNSTLQKGKNRPHHCGQINSNALLFGQGLVFEKNKIHFACIYDASTDHLCKGVQMTICCICKKQSGINLH